MQVEDITWVGFTSRGTTNDQRNVAVGLRVLGQVIIDDEGVTSALHDLFTHGASGIRREVLQRCRFRSSRHDDDGMLHRAVLFQDGLRASNGRVFLTDRHIDADQVLALLVNDGIDSDSCLTRLAVTDDQFALTTTNGDHAVDSLDTSLYRSIHRLACYHTRGHTLYRAIFIGNNRPSVVDWLAQGVYHAADQCVTYRYRDNAARCTYLVIFTKMCVITQDGATDRFLFKVKGHAHDPGTWKFYQFEIFHILQAVDASDTILHGDDSADASGFCFASTEARDVFLDDGADFVSP